MPFLATQSQIRSGLQGMGSAHTHATRAAAARNAVVRKVVRLRGLSGLGDVNCTIDPQTGGRVCGNSPALPVPVPVAATPVSNLPPGGSYTQTCNSVSYNNGVLTANCERIDGGFQPSTLNVGSNCPGGTVVNINGQLQCATQVPIATQANPNPVASLVPGSPTSPANVVNPATGQSIPVIIDPNTGIAFTSEYPLSQINPITGYPFNFAGQAGAAPSNFVNTAPAVPVQSATSGIPWSKILLYGGIGIGGLIVLKITGVIKK